MIHVDELSKSARDTRFFFKDHFYDAYLEVRKLLENNQMIAAEFWLTRIQAHLMKEMLIVHGDHPMFG